MTDASAPPLTEICGCLKFEHTDEEDRDWFCVCGHPVDDHGGSPSKPAGRCRYVGGWSRG